MERARVAGRTVAYHRAGGGPPLLLLHGGWSDGRAWTPQLRDLAAEFDVLAPDLPGCGGSDEPPDGVDLHWYADAVAGLVDVLGLASVHLGGISFGGGLAIAADRGTVRMMRASAGDRGHYLQELAATHRWVLSGLTLVVLSGLALLASDFETFWGSWLYWLKMALVVVLLWNGLGMTRAENALKSDASETSSAWNKLHRAAVTSLVLWFAITLLGVAVVNFS